MTGRDIPAAIVAERPQAPNNGVRDVAGGVLVAGLGVAAGAIGSRYEFGTLDRIGPGFFPAVLAVALIGLGIALIVVGARTGRSSTLRVSWNLLRPVVLVIGAILAFAFLLDRFGMLVSGFVLILFGQQASQTASFRQALVLAMILPPAAALLFVYGLGVPLRVSPF